MKTDGEEGFKREDIEDFLIELVTAFASENEYGEWWGHDTNLGDCMEHFSKAQNAASKWAGDKVSRARAEEAATCILIGGNHFSLSKESLSVKESVRQAVDKAWEEAAKIAEEEITGQSLYATSHEARAATNIKNRIAAALRSRISTKGKKGA